MAKQRKPTTDPTRATARGGAKTFDTITVILNDASILELRISLAAPTSPTVKPGRSKSDADFGMSYALDGGRQLQIACAVRSGAAKVKAALADLPPAIADKPIVVKRLGDP